MKIFLSYRRQDLLVAGTIRGIHQRLSQKFGSKNVFMDVDAIPPGGNFREVIGASVGQADVLLAMIGPQWGDLLAARLGDEEDFVRVEIESAVQKGVPVVPILVGDAVLLGEADLPLGVTCIASRQALEIDPGRRFDADMARLIADLSLHYGSPAERARFRRKSEAERSRSARHRGLAGFFFAVFLFAMAAVAIRDGRLGHAVATLRGAGPVSGVTPAEYRLDLPALDDEAAPAGSAASGSPGTDANTAGIDERERQRRSELLEIVGETALQGQRAMIEKDYEGAEAAFHRALDLLPDLASLQVWRSDCLAYLGDAALLQALQLEREGRFGAAIRLVDLVLSPEVAPDNGAAKRLKERLGARKLGVEDLNLLANPPISEIQKKLDRIILPAVEFVDTPLEIAIDFLRIKSSELDITESNPSRKGVPIILRLGGSGGTAVVSLRLTNVPLAEALRHTTHLAGVKYVVEPHSVLVVPLWEQSGTMITRFYRFTKANMEWAKQSASLAGDPFAVPGQRITPRSSDVEEWMSNWGVSFPAGACAEFDSEKELLSMQNTPEAQELLEAIIESIQSTGP